MKELFILPFDHRNSFLKKMFGVDGREPNQEEINKTIELKRIVYDGFKLAVKQGSIPKKSAGILVDEEFGDGIIKDAVANRYLVCLSTEKSGQSEFDFEYGDQFGEHINKYKPAFVKALVRYNPQDDRELNNRQKAKLKQLSDFCHQNGYKFIIEPLVPATKEQLANVNNDQKIYDNKLRPDLMVQMIAEMQSAGVNPDVWKIEGLENQADYEKLVKQIKSGNRKSKAIVLGRGADDFQVEKWLKAGAKVRGVIGFAVGRTIFWQSLFDYYQSKITREEAIEKISGRYQHFYQVFKGKI